jgi:hypothetical protein
VVSKQRYSYVAGGSKFLDAILTIHAIHVIVDDDRTIERLFYFSRSPQVIICTLDNRAEADEKNAVPWTSRLRTGDAAGCLAGRDGSLSAL